MTTGSETPLAIVGIGCLFPKAGGPGAYWANVKHGVDCITAVPPTHWNPDDYFDADPKRPDRTYARRGGFLSPVDFNPLEFGIAPRDIEATDTSQLLGLVAAKQALKDAGVVFADAVHEATTPGAVVDRNRVAVILGVTGTLELVIPLGARLGHPKWKQAMRDAGIPEDRVTDAAERIAESYVPWQENSFPGLLGNVVAGRIANKLDLGGTNCVVDAACASSLSALHLAALELTANRADVVVTGGVDTFNDIFMFMCFSKTPALSPTGDAKPFDAAGDGTILGEGIGVVVLKRLTDAERDGDRIYAVLRGIGSSSDGKGNAIYAPSAAGQKKALLNAYRDAGVTPDTIELVKAHGTGTKVGDAVEVSALTEVYGNAGGSKPRPWCAIGSVKSQIGHTKAAAGAASLIKAALALHYKVLPPTVKVTLPAEPLRAADSPFYVNTTMRPWLPRADHPRRAALSAFGFGGSNFHAVLEEYEYRKTEVDWDGTIEILALGAATPAALVTELERISNQCHGPESPGTVVPGLCPAKFARAAAQSRAAFDPAAPCRLVLVAQRDSTDVAKLLAAAQSRLATDPHAKSWQTSDGAYYGSGPAAGGLAVLFPGQGSQYPGMLRELACLFPEALATLAEANQEILAQLTDAQTPRLSDLIYPPPAFDPETAAAQEAALRATDVAQPALGAVSFGAWRVLAGRFGMAAEAFAGHSFGELPALAAAGRIDPGDLFALSRLRGKLMAQQRSGDAGAMLAVLAPAAEVEATLAHAGLKVVIANRNAPSQLVLSGSTAEIGKAEAAFAGKKLRTVRLPVAAAFHSPLVADAAEPFRVALDGIEFQPGDRPIFANTTAAEYPADPDAARDLLGRQLAKPVDFVGEIRAMLAAGVRTFLEVGPGSVLTRLTSATLAESGVGDTAVFALDASAGRKSGLLDLAQVLARLTVLGHPVHLAAWEAGSPCRPPATDPKPGLTVSLSGANYVSPRPKRPPLPPAPTVAPRSFLLAGPPMSHPSSNGPAPSALTQALQLTHQTLTALQTLQEQTAKLHQHFLESQDQAQRTLFGLIAQQQALMFPAGMPGAVAAPVVGEKAPGLQSRGFAPTPTLPQDAPVGRVESSRPDVAQPVGSRRLDPTYQIAPSLVPPAPPELTQTVRLPTPTVRTPVPTPAPAPRPTPAPVVAKGEDRSEVEQTLLDVVAEKTGYPATMLDLSMALDTDLGVDSIKRVEILSALQEKLPNAPAVKSEHLGTLHTLQDVADFLAADVGPATETVSAFSTAVATAAAVAAASEYVQIAAPTAPTPADSGVIPFVSEATASGPTADEVRTVLLNVVAEKTGYPAEMLDLSMALDTDLGVDSIKRVEILSALQEKLPHAPAVKSEHLGTLHTLKDVADFLATPGPASNTVKVNPSDLPAPPRLDDLFPAAPPTTQKVPFAPTGRPPAPDATVSELLAPVTEQIAAIRHTSPADTVQINRRPANRTPRSDAASNPAETYRQPIAPINLNRIDRSILQAVDLDPNAGRPRLPLPEGATFWVVAPDDDPLTREVVAQLTAAGFAPTVYPWADPDSVKPGGNPAALVLIAPAHTPAGLPLNRLGFRWVQHTGPKLRQLARHSAAVALVTVARLDGMFGLGDLDPSADPTAGGLAGLVKTVRAEWPEIGCKAIDVAVGFAADEPTRAAAAVADEVMTAGPTEVGIAATHRCTLEIARTVRRQLSATGPALGPKDVVLVTGGARGVTAEVAVALAEVYQPTLVLTGRTPAPTGSEPDWARGLTDEAALKKAIADHLGAAATPKAVGDQFAALVAQREVARTMSRIEAAGAKASYFAVNVAAGRQVANLLHQVQMKYGAVTALVHGAGVLADRKIEDLTPEQFDAVYTTKVDGLRHLLDLLANQPLKAVILFSSTTARFGRTGQLAYACANEVLNKTAVVEARKRPEARVVAVNWGPWEGGMVTPALRRVFESEGIGLIPLTEGGLFAVQELTAAGKAVEVIALGKPVRGAKATARALGEPSAGSAPHPVLPAPGAPPGTNPPAAELTLVFERSVEIATHPVLRSHVLDGRAVVPMALHMEWLAHAALHGNPGLVFHGFNDLRITHGVMVEDGLAAPLKALAGKAVKHDKVFHVAVELRGKRRDGRDAVHSRAEVVLTAALPKAPTAASPPIVQPYPHPIEEIYRYFLFHGPDLHGIERVDGLSDTAFLATAYPAPAPAEWFTGPLRSAWVADPLVLDASFQMMILWSFAQHGAGSLPCFAGRYRQYRRAFPAGPVRVVIRVTRDNGSFARSDIDYLDADGQVIAQVQDYECVIDRQLDQAFRRNQLAPRVKA